MSDVLVTILDGDAPYGIYLKDDRAAYRALRNAFNGGLTAYRALIETPDAMEDTDLLKANVAAWAALAEAVKGVLQTQSKDLEIFCWYIAALSHRSDPLAQVAEAIASMANLIDEHWDGLQPILPEAKRKGDTDAAQKSQVAELKMRPFAQLFGEAEGTGLLNGPLNYLPMLGNITLATYTTALRGEGVEPLIAQAHESIPTDHEDLTVRIEALQSIIASATKINNKLLQVGQQAGVTPSSAGYFLRQVNNILKMLRQLTEGSNFAFPGAEQTPDAKTEDVLPANSSSSPAISAAPAKIAAGSAVSRDGALNTIAVLAKFFRKTEPHSPVHLLLDRAYRWAHLPAEELFSELLGGDSNGMARLSQLTGLESAGFSSKTSAQQSLSRTAELPEQSSYSSYTPPVAQAVQYQTRQEDAEPEFTDDPTPASEAMGSDESEPLAIQDFEW